MAKIVVVLFDLGSTLLYFDGSLHELILEGRQRLFQTLVDLGYALDEDFIPAFRAGLHDYFHQRDVDFLEYTIEQVLRQTLAEGGVWGEVPHEHLRAALDEMYAVTQAHWKLESDTLPVLTELKQHGYRLGLISNAADADDARALLAQNELVPWFEQVLISAEVGYRKPHPRIFQLALDFFGVQPGQAVMVGDKLGADVLGAKNAGLATVWITRRANRSDNLSHEDTIRPDEVIENLAELPGLLAKWESPGRFS